jgi:hypothetical protein
VAGGAASPELQGRDALGASAEAIYAEGGIESREEWRALLRGYDKVVWTFMKDGEEVTGMYNIADDPEEVHDLKAASEHRLTRDSLWALAERWMERLEDGRDSFGLRLRR